MLPYSMAPWGVLFTLTTPSFISVITDMGEPQEHLKCRLVGTPRISHKNPFFPNTEASQEKKNKA